MGVLKKQGRQVLECGRVCDRRIVLISFYHDCLAP